MKSFKEFLSEATKKSSKIDSSGIEVTETGDSIKIRSKESSGPYVGVIKSLYYALSHNEHHEYDDEDKSALNKLHAEANKLKGVQIFSASGVDLSMAAQRKRAAAGRRDAEFKSGTLVVKGMTVDQVKRFVELACDCNNEWADEREARKASAPARKKANAAAAREDAKERTAEFDKEFGKGTRKRITFRQVGGDDGYQWTVFVDGRTYVNGLTRREVDHYVRMAMDGIAKKEKLGKYAGK